ncbi:MAG: anaerobic ribonucleoside-triphosphate reductase [Cyanobacteria bacterium RYN_339]|nr:anaerobic ribonucleoside-triphosphate reductase [Cyanobacteria bacterium RYN_339]
MSLMVMAREISEIQKRDGRIVAFDRSKIVAAIMRSAQAVQGSDYNLADELAQDVLRRVGTDASGKIPTVETIQDTIEKVLIEHGHARTAKAFILYRARRSRIREGKSELMDTVAEILSNDEAPARAAGSRWRRAAIGVAASREFYMNRVLPEAMAEAHEAGAIHLHGLADYAQAPHGFVVPYLRLLQDGFASGHGFMRAPKRAASAAALTSVILQAAQADCHGGQTLATFDSDLATVLPAQTTPAELDQAMESLVYNLNTMSVQGGDHLPYASLQVGLDVSPLGREVTRALLTAAGRGLGRGEAALRPHVVFLLRAGVNLNPGDPNFDLTRQAVELACDRRLVTFVHDGEGVAYAGHEARVGAGTGVGQVARLSVNLPRLALTARREATDFHQALDAAIRVAAQHLVHRLDALGARPAADFPFLMGQRLWNGSAALTPEAPIRDVLREGTLAIGLVGLAQALVVLAGEHHGGSPSVQAEGLTIIRRAAALCAELGDQLGVRLVLQSADADGVSERFARLDRREFGLIKGVTEMPGYSAGVSLPADAGLAWHERLTIEGAYAPLFAGGCVFRDVQPTTLPAEQAIARVQAAAAAGVRAYALDFPLSICQGCGHTAAPVAECAKCASPGETARGIVRRRGYLELS